MEWFTCVKRFPFEYISVPVANGYDELLKITYGDYMQYDRQRGRAHNYPFYKKQMKLMEQNMALKKYGIDISEITKEE